MIQCKDKKIIGITGGIASGKSTAVAIIKKYYPVIEADKVAKDILDIGEEGYNKLLEEFTSSILNKDLSIDRDKLAKKIFTNPEVRYKMNNILHPIILEEIKGKIDKLNSEFVFIEIPLLFESKELINSSGLEFYEVWTISIDLNKQIDRLVKRDAIDKFYAINKINSQSKDEYRNSQATRIIYNNSSIKSFEEKIEGIMESFK